MESCGLRDPPNVPLHRSLGGEHINWIASFLATELSADVVTAPEPVTLNGQNIENTYSIRARLTVAMPSP